MRIVGGIYKRTPLAVGNRPGLRPTPERVRETVFDWLNHLLGGLTGISCCDMFAGSGALGLEAASRGAELVVSIELDRRGCEQLRAVVEKLGAGLHADPQGLVYLESDRDFDEQALADMGLETVRSGKAGAVFYRLTARARPKQG